MRQLLNLTDKPIACQNAELFSNPMPGVSKKLTGNLAERVVEELHQGWREIKIPISDLRVHFCDSKAIP